ncbi:uncharacterized protein LOC116255065 isoform X2 [Nymphaea colorata]|uniref:uncharacterized protein LOC116255065 isoform X2 n=1 Tax=Nymphaea colorata TaxID=210225 RepID=UPI00214E63CA|nr:uncharacterized protein LOC116255065 isoform X2 [Nymphaea colorata]
MTSACFLAPRVLRWSRMRGALQQCMRDRHDYVYRQEQEHEFSESSLYLGSWKPPKDPREAEAALGLLRRDYAKKVKDLRKQYMYEMEMQQQEKERKDEARRETIRLAKEERKAAKAKIAEGRAAERLLLDQEFRETLTRLDELLMIMGDQSEGRIEAF